MTRVKQNEPQNQKPKKLDESLKPCLNVTQIYQRFFPLMYSFFMWEYTIFQTINTPYLGSFKNSASGRKGTKHNDLGGCIPLVLGPMITSIKGVECCRTLVQ